MSETFIRFRDADGGEIIANVRHILFITRPSRLAASSQAIVACPGGVMKVSDAVALKLMETLASINLDAVVQ